MGLTRIVVALTLMALLATACGGDEEAILKKIADLKKSRAALNEQMQPLTRARFDTSNAVIPAKTAYDRALKAAGGDAGASEVVEAKDAWDAVNRAFTEAREAELVVKRKYDDIVDQLAKLERGR